MKFCESEPGNTKSIQKPLNVSPKANIVMVNYWLAKQEPSGTRGYNFEQLKKDKIDILHTIGGDDTNTSVSYTHLTLPTTPYV